MAEPVLDVVPMEDRAIAPTGEPSLGVILQEAARSGNIEVLERVTALYERTQRWNAEKAFDAAKARLHPRLPQIAENGRVVVNGQTRSTYARYEDIDAVIRPLLAEEGFSISYDTEPTPSGIVVTGILSHVMGHRETKRTPPMPSDTSGSKNPVQAIKSTVQYGKRMLLEMHLNIVTRNADDDGNHGRNQTISEDQQDTISTLIQDTGADRAKLLQFANADSLASIRQCDYQRVVDALNRKVKR